MRHDADSLTTSPEGMAALAASEGVVPAIYLDSVGVETFGVGVTHWAVGKETMSQLPVAMPDDVDGMVDYAMELFAKVLPSYEQHVKDAVTVPLAQHEFDALVHFCYNIGGPNFKRSKLLQNLNAGNYEAAGQSGFHGWLKPPELRGRRDHESAMFLHGDYGTSRVPVYKTNGAKRLRGQLKTLPRSTVVAMIVGDRRPARFAPPVIAPRPKMPQEVVDLIEETERGGAESNTNILAGIQALGIPFGSVMAVISDIDPIVIIAAIAAVTLLGALYFLRSRGRKTRRAQAARAAVQAMQ